MAMKRAHEDTVEDSAHLLDLSQRSKTPRTEASKRPQQDHVNHSSLKLEGTQKHSNDNVASEHSTQEEKAVQWLRTQMGLLKQLTSDKGLREKCSAIAGSDFVKNAIHLGESLDTRLPSVERNSNSSAEHMPAVPGQFLTKDTLAARQQPAEVSEWPPVPAIKNAELERLAFVHKSVSGGIQYIEGNDMHDYERLEFYGDAVLELAATRILWRWYPAEATGRLSQLRERMVKNETLAGFAQICGFDQRTQMVNNPAVLKKLRGSSSAATNTTKILGDVFEAYVGAVVLSRPDDGFATVEEWMAQLWWPLVRGRETRAVDKWAKQELGKRIMGGGIKLAYEETKRCQELGNGRYVFTVGAFLTGWGWFHHKLGEGQGPNMNEAGWHAAADALKNPLVFQVFRLKTEFDRRVKAEKEREGGPRQQVLDDLKAEFKPTKEPSTTSNKQA